MKKVLLLLSFITIIVTTTKSQDYISSPSFGTWEGCSAGDVTITDPCGNSTWTGGHFKTKATFDAGTNTVTFTTRRCDGSSLTAGVLYICDGLTSANDYREYPAGGESQMSISYDLSSLTSGSRTFNILIAQNNTSGLTGFRFHAGTFTISFNSSLIYSPGSISCGPTGDVVDIDITANIDWTISSNRTWINLSDVGGSGNGTIIATIDATTSTADRSGTITINSSEGTETISVNQNGVAEYVDITPSTPQTVSPNGATLNFSVSSNTTWDEIASETWMSFSGLPGSGNGSFSLTIPAYSGTTDRSGFFSVGSTTIAVTQTGISTTVIPSTPQTVATAGEVLTFNVNSNGSWAAFSTDSWIHVNTASGNGNGTVTVTVDANTQNTERSGSVTIGGQTISIISQACEDVGDLRTCDYYSLFPSSATCSPSPNLRFTAPISISGNVATGMGQIYLDDYKGNTLTLLSWTFGNYDLIVNGTEFSTPATATLNSFNDFAGLDLRLDAFEVTCDGVIAQGNVGFPKINLGNFGSYEASLEQLYLMRSGLDFSGNINIEEVGIKNVFQLKSFDLTFDTYENYLDGNASINTKLLDIDAGATIKNSKLNRVAFYVTGNNVGIPLGATGLQLISGGGQVDNLSNPNELKIDISVGMSVVGLSEVGNISVDGYYYIGDKYGGRGNLIVLDRQIAQVGFDVWSDLIKFEGWISYWDVLQTNAYFSIQKYSNATKVSGAFNAGLYMPDPNSFEKDWIRIGLQALGYTQGRKIAGLGVYATNTPFEQTRKGYLAGYVSLDEIGLSNPLFHGISCRLDVKRPNGMKFKIGTNYSKLEPEVISALGLDKSTTKIKYFTINSFETDMIIEGYCSSGVPDFTITKPDGTIITTSNYEQYDDVGFLDANNNYCFFRLNKPIFGDYKVQIINGDSINVWGGKPRPIINLKSASKSGNTLIIEWDDSAPNSNGEITLGLTQDPNNPGGIIIAEAINENDNTDSYTFDLSEVETGLYYVYALLIDEEDQFALDVFDTPVQVVSIQAPNSPLNFTAIANGTGIDLSWDKNNPQGMNYLVYFEENDKAISYESMNISTGDTSSYAINKIMPGRTYQIMVVAADDNWNKSLPSNVVTVTWNSSLENNPPYFVEQTITESIYSGEIYNYTAIAIDADAEPISFSLKQAPNGMSIDNTGNITWNPTNEDIGYNHIEIVAEDPSGGRDSLSYNLSVYTDASSIANLYFNKQVYVDYDDLGSIILTNLDLDSDEDMSDIQNLRLFSNTDMTGIDITLKETGKKTKEFIEFFNFTESPSNGNNLQVSVGDTIWAEYIDNYPDTVIREYAYFTEFKANFIDGGVACAGDSIQFVNKSTGSGMKYAWDFGDGQTSDKRHPVHIFNPEHGIGTATYSVTLNITDDEGRNSSKTQQVSVYRKPLVDIGDNVEGCGSVTLDAQNEGSTYEWITGETEQTIKTLEDGNYSVIVTNEHGCSNTDDVNVIVHPIPTPEFSAQPHICENATAIDLDGNYDNQGTFFGEGVNGYLYDPLLTNVGFHEIGYWYVDEHGCVDTTYRTIEVRPLPEPEFIENDYNLCITETLNLNAIPAGGEFSGDGVNNGVFSAINAGVGEHLVNYYFIDSYGCANSTDQLITVSLLPEVSIEGLDANYCTNSSIVTLTGLPEGGFFSGQGIVNNTFNPSLIGEGTAEITYTYTDMQTECTNSITVETVVNNIPEVELTSPYYEICDNNEAILLTGYPENGVFSGNGITNAILGEFTPSLAEIEYNEISYTVTNLDGCNNSNNIIIRVIETPEALITGDDEICQGSTATLVGSGGEEYTWSTNSTDATIEVNPIENTIYELTVTNGEICSDNTSFTVIVNALPEQPDILQDEMVLSTNILASIYQWFLNNEIIENSDNQTYLATEFGDYQVQIWDENGCSNISEIYSLTTTNIKPIEGVNSIEIFPNPTNGEFSLCMDLKEQKEVEIQIFDAHGKFLTRHSINYSKGNSKNEIDISDYSAGIYYMNIIIDNQMIIRKIVLK